MMKNVLCILVCSGGCESSPDRLTVRDGADQSATTTSILAQFCGTANGQTVTSSKENLHVELVTDAVDQRQGFAAEFSFFTASPVTADGETDRLPGGGQQTGNVDAPLGQLSISQSVDIGSVASSSTSNLSSELQDGNHNGMP